MEGRNTFDTGADWLYSIISEVKTIAIKSIIASVWPAWGVDQVQGVLKVH